MKNPAEILPVPHPYSAMIAICSDLDETPGEESYLNTCRYLNTENDSGFGRGVGIEVGNSMFFDMGPADLSYWNGSEEFRAQVRHLMRTGFIDAIHSLGDTAGSRHRAQETFAHLAKHECKLGVWIDHAVAPSNFGVDIMRGYGDIPGSDVYIADLAADYGIKYFWRGRVTSVIGQDVLRQLGGIWQSGLPLRSGITLAKEVAKGFYGRTPGSQYQMHTRNDLLLPISLSDGSPAFEFLRANPHPGGISCGDNAIGLATAIGEPVLDLLENRRGKAIIYTHLGKEIDPKLGFPRVTREALEVLASRHAEGRILVCTTFRMLEFARLTSSATATWEDCADDIARVNVAVPSWSGQIDGLSVVVPSRAAYEMRVNGIEQSFTICRSDDRCVISTPWKRLNYHEV